MDVTTAEQKVHLLLADSSTSRSMFLRERKVDQGFLTLMLGFRFAALLGVVLRFGINRSSYNDSGLFNMVRLSLLLFLFYFLILAYLRVVCPRLFLTRASKWVQIVLDTVAFSAWYLLTKDAESDLFLLYVLPLLTAAEYFGWLEIFIAWAAVSFSFAGVLWGITTLFVAYPQQVFWKVFVPREFLFMVVAAAYLVHERFPGSIDLDEEQQALLSEAATIRDGIYVIDRGYHLLLVSDSLRERHGEHFEGRRCFSFLRARNEPCEGCPHASLMAPGSSKRAATVDMKCVDCEGHWYAAQVTVSTIGTNDNLVHTVGIVRDVSKRALFQQQLERYTRNVERAMEIFTEEVRYKNELMNRQLSAVFETSLAAISSDEEETIERVMARTAEILDCQAGVLRLLGKNREGQDSLVARESYGYARRYAERVRFLDLDKKSVVVRAFLTRHPLVCKDIQCEESGGVFFADLARRLNLRSMICLPLMSKNAAFGTLSLYRDKVRPFTPDEVRLGQALTNFLSVTIENCNLYREISAKAAERKAWLDALHDLSHQLAGFDEVQSLLERVVEITRERLNSETSSLFLLRNGKLRREAIGGVENEWFVEESYGIGDGITGSALVAPDGGKYGQCVLENNVAESDRVVSSHLLKYRQKLKSGEVKHLIAVPLNGQDGAFGVLRIVNRLDTDGQLSSDGFTQHDTDVLYTIACMVGIALENSRLLAETRRRVDELAQLHGASQAIVSALDLDSVLNQIVPLAGMVVGSAFTSVVLVEGEDLVRSAEDFQGIPPLHVRARPDGTTRQIVATGEPVIVHDVRDGGLHNPALIRAGIRSYVGVPIAIKDNILGVMFVHSLQPDVFRDRISILTTFANQAAIAIENARLYELEQDRRRLADTLRETAEVVSSALNLDEVLESILDQLGQVVPYDGSSIQLLEDNESKILACRGFDDPDKVMGLAFPVDDPRFPNHDVVVNREPYIVEDVQEKYSHFSDPLYHITHRGAIRSWLGVPLEARGRLIGMMTLDKTSPGYYTEEHARLAVTFANQAAVAIQNARLFANLTRRVAELTALQQVSLQLTSSLDLSTVLDTIAESVVQLVSACRTQIFLYDEATGKFTFGGGLRAKGESGELIGLPRPNGLTTKVAKSGQRVVINDAQDHPLFSSPEVRHHGIRAIAGFPLKRRDTVSGVLKVVFYRPHTFGEDELRVLSLLADQAAIAIENARLFTEMHQRTQALEALNTISLAITKHLEMPDLLRSVVEQAAGLLRAKGGGVYLLDEAGRQLKLVAVHGLPERLIGTSFEAGDSVVGQVVATQAPVSVEDYANWPNRLRRYDGCKFTAVAGAPIAGENGVLGAIAVHDDVKERVFSESDLDLLSQLANHAAVALEKVRLYEEIVEQKNRLQDYVSAMSSKLVEHADLEGLYNLVVHSGAKFLGAEDCSLYLVDKDAQTIDFVASSHLPHHLLGVKRTRISSAPKAGLTAYVAATGEPLSFVGSEFKAHPAWDGEFLDHLQYFHSGSCDSLLIVPMRNPGGAIVGVLKLENRLGRYAGLGFSEFDRELLITLANKAAIDIERVKMYQRLSNEAAQKERERLGGELHEAMNFFHAAVMLEAEAIEDKLERGHLEEARTGLKQLWRASRHTYSELDHILQDLRDPILEKEGLVSALTNYAMMVAPKYVHIRCDTERRCRPEIEHALYRIAQGAINNAVRHAGLKDVPGGRILVQLTRQSGKLTLWVEDNGKGFNVEILNRSYTEAFGLVRMQAWARMLGTRLQVESSPGQGTVVTVTVPQKKEEADAV